MRACMATPTPTATQVDLLRIRNNDCDHIVIMHSDLLPVVNLFQNVTRAGDGTTGGRHACRSTHRHASHSDRMSKQQRDAESDTNCISCIPSAQAVDWRLLSTADCCEHDAHINTLSLKTRIMLVVDTNVLPMIATQLPWQVTDGGGRAWCRCYYIAWPVPISRTAPSMLPSAHSPYHRVCVLTVLRVCLCDVHCAVAGVCTGVRCGKGQLCVPKLDGSGPTCRCRLKCKTAESKVSAGVGNSRNVTQKLTIDKVAERTIELQFEVGLFQSTFLHNQVTDSNQEEIWLCHSWFQV